MRLNRKQLDNLKAKYGVDRIWSFSRINTFSNCATEYQKHYLEHVKLDSGNVYTEFGTFSHNTIQSLIRDEIKYDEVFPKWQDEVGNWEVDPRSYQFDSDKIKTGYISNLNHYFKHTQVPVGSQFETEKPVLATIGDNNKYVFVGYIDTQYVDEDGNLVLVDYKTSSRSSFSKAKLPEKSLQLMLYAIGKHQHSHIPYSKIRCMFDMMKYVTVHYRQENGKMNTSIQERAKWVAKMEKKLATKLKKLHYDQDQIDEMIQVAIMANNLDNMPQEVQEQFLIENYVIELDISEENCDRVAKVIEQKCDEIMEFEALSKEDQDSWLEINHPYNPNDYYDKKLCSWHTSPQFKEQEKTLDDILQPEMANDTEDDLFLSGLFTEDEELAGVFSE